MNLKNTARNGVNRVAESLQVFKKDVFDLNGVPAFREFYTLFMFPWQYIYRGYYAAWHDVPIQSIGAYEGIKKPTRRMATMNAGRIVCQTLARYVWGENCTINVTQKGRETPEGEKDPLQAYVDHVLADNDFWTAFGEHLEKSFALGGAATKEWVEVPKDAEGNDAGPGRVKISYHMAPQFIPTAWDNHNVTEGIFLSREAKDGYYYSRVEWHKRQGDTTVVTNDLYRMPIKETAEPQNILGWWYPLSMMYPLLSPSTEIYGLSRTAFQYFRPFGANNFDDNSPLGVSAYSSAMDTLRSLDICLDSFQREFVLGKRRIIVPAQCIRTVPDPRTGRMVRYFDANDEIYEALSTDSPDALKIQDNAVELRVEEHVAAINAFLSILCAQVGFDPGTLSFDKAQGIKTATEVISQNSKTYNTIVNHQNNLRGALRNMVTSILELSAEYGIEYEGQPVASLIAGGYEIGVTFDDSIVEDTQSNINQGIMLINNKLMSKHKFLTDKKFGFCYTEEQYQDEMKRIREESKVNAVDVDFLTGGE